MAASARVSTQTGRETGQRGQTVQVTMLAVYQDPVDTGGASQNARHIGAGKHLPEAEAGTAGILGEDGPEPVGGLHGGCHCSMKR